MVGLGLYSDGLSALGVYRFPLFFGKKPEEAWEAYDMIYRNMGAALTALGQAEEGLEYYERSVRVKRSAGVEPSWFDLWDIGRSHALLAFQNRDSERLLIARDSIQQAVERHETEEGDDKIMHAKILHSLGETYLAKGSMLDQNNDNHQKIQNESKNEYETALAYFKKAHELFGSYSGQNCPLTGGQARAVADALKRLERYNEAKPYLRNALTVESTKDMPQLKQLYEVLDHVLTVYQKSNDRNLEPFVNVLGLH